MNQSSDQISAFIASTPLGSPRSTPRIQKRPQKGFKHCSSCSDITWHLWNLVLSDEYYFLVHTYDINLSSMKPISRIRFHVKLTDRGKLRLKPVLI